MIQIALDAHCLDEEFEAQLAEAGITIVGRQGEPWAVVFAGRRDVLIPFVREHWGQMTIEEATDLVDSSTIQEMP